ncbi:13329_t:CDS:2 [Acaulospora colombiana]|uniref:13329_t:CDS:1 n=1 Tax=Acaulospora colombiana TaxID=27376 RepID=A0ACA9MP42_9GLOM|nr:13329_t:CDS:2 [Acaulospora colombiana]
MPLLEPICDGLNITDSPKRPNGPLPSCPTVARPTSAATHT